MAYLPGSLYSFQSVTSTPSPLVVANRVAYVCEGSSMLTFQLPLSCLAGLSFRIYGRTCLWKIVQGASQSITFGNLVTNLGASGFLTSTLITDKIEITCLLDNFVFDVSTSFGNITIN